METEQPNIEIRALARQNAVFLSVLGAAGLLLCFLAANFWWHDFRLQIVLLLLVSFMTLLIGIFKHFEPVNSFELTPKALVYCHRYGRLSVSWDNIMIIDVPTVTEGLESKALGYIGLKLHNGELLAQTLPRRLANNLLQEQRDLYFLGCQLEGISVLERQINDAPFKTTTGQKLIGPVAAWMHRMQMMRRIYGYDLFIPSNACDRPVDGFIDLLKQCKAASIGYDNVSKEM